MRYLIFIAIIFCVNNNVYAQPANKDALVIAHNIFEQIKSIKQFEYDYSLHLQFPDGHTDQLKGTVYMNRERKCMYSVNTATTILYVNDWYYRADHRKKVISIIDLNKHYKKEQKAQFENEIFSNGYLDQFTDSLLFKYASVKNIQHAGDIITLDISFSKKALIKDMKISFDDKKKLPVQFYISMFYPWQGNDKRYKGKGTESLMTCSNYSQGKDIGKYETDQFFTVNNGKVALKKYANYTLKTEL